MSHQIHVALYDMDKNHPQYNEHTRAIAVPKGLVIDDLIGWLARESIKLEQELHQYAARPVTK